MANKFNGVIGLVLSLIIFAILFPTGLLYVYTMQYANVSVGGTTYVLGEVMDPTLVTLLVTILPIVLVIGAIMMFMKGRQG